MVAVEPSASMRTVASQLHPETSVRWIADSLPALSAITKSGMSFDLILLSAVWMHVPASDRPRAFRKVINLLNPGGLIAITLRHGPDADERAIYPVSLVELETLVRGHGAFVERSVEAKDELGRSDVRWTQVAIRLPDDGTGALPLLRHIILNDDKSSTYKLGLLRTLCRIADGASGFARPHDDAFIAIPLGLVALTSIRLFKPLLESGLPQTPSNIDYQGLGFVTEAFRKLTEVSHLDLRVGMAFTGKVGVALHEALRDAATTITRMPATHMAYPNGGQIFPVNRIGRVLRPSRVLLDLPYLSSFGDLLVPGHLWRALQRFDAWIEPALVSEWTRWIKFYASRQARNAEDSAVAVAMTWEEPTRDVRVARERASRLSEAGQSRRTRSTAILRLERPKARGRGTRFDDCFPWAIWPCGDLWNLMPAHRTVNQREKRSRLPSDQLLRVSKDRIMSWWEAAYLQEGSVLPERFWLEAVSSLPSIGADSVSLHDVFEAVCLRRLKLKHDQQVPEWAGEQYLAAAGSLRS